jgi:hypothetical protein
VCKIGGSHNGNEQSNLLVCNAVLTGILLPVTVYELAWHSIPEDFELSASTILHVDSYALIILLGRRETDISVA